MDQGNNCGAGATPTATNTAGAVPSIDTPEFRELLGDFGDANMVGAKIHTATVLIAHIDDHVQAVLRSNQEKGGAQ